jgi:hydroxyacyl-ACP dehydratase HTD2-like protein with hotdog domain
MDQVCYEDVAIGDAIGPQVVTLDERQMFFFSAAMYNGHRIHYDLRWARDVEGYPDLVVSGTHQASLLTKLVTDWMGPNGRLVCFSTQNRGSAFVGDVLRFVGHVVEKRETDGKALVDLDIREEKNEDEVLVRAHATVALPQRIRPTLSGT